jgi:flavin reductase (DIM6/NTAB) family NADH-FMN oxidoreductase RutF
VRRFADVASADAAAAWRGQHASDDPGPAFREGARVNSNNPVGLTRSSGRPETTEFRAAMQRLPTGLAVVAAMVDGRPMGVLVGTFTSVSLEPLLVGFLADRTSRTLAALLHCEHWGFSVLGQHDTAVTDAFRAAPHERFTAVHWHLSACGAPLLDNAVITIEASRHGVLPAGDHDFVLGEVKSVRARVDGRPLVFFDGGMTQLTPRQFSGDDYLTVCWQDLG